MQINIEKRHLFILLALVVFLAGVILVIGYGGSNPQVLGHSSGEINFTGHQWKDCVWRNAVSGVYNITCNNGEYVAGIHYEPMEWTDLSDTHAYPEVDMIYCCKL